MKNNIKVQRAIHDLTLSGLANKIAKLFFSLKETNKKSAIN